MIFVADDCIFDPIVKSLQILKFDIRRRWDFGIPSDDPPILEACLIDHNILITFDLGMPPQAYYYEFGQNGLTVIQLRWKTNKPKDWQQIVEVILRDSDTWKETAVNEPSVISVSYKGGSRSRAWKDIPPIIEMQVKNPKPPDSTF